MDYYCSALMKHFIFIESEVLKYIPTYCLNAFHENTLEKWKNIFKTPQNQAKKSPKIYRNGDDRYFLYVWIESLILISNRRLTITISKILFVVYNYTECVQTQENKWFGSPTKDVVAQIANEFFLLVLFLQ